MYFPLNSHIEFLDRVTCGWIVCSFFAEVSCFCFRPLCPLTQVLRTPKNYVYQIPVKNEWKTYICRSTIPLLFWGKQRNCFQTQLWAFDSAMALLLHLLYFFRAQLAWLRALLPDLKEVGFRDWLLCKVKINSFLFQIKFNILDIQVQLENSKDNTRKFNFDMKTFNFNVKVFHVCSHSSSTKHFQIQQFRSKLKSKSSSTQKSIQNEGVHWRVLQHRHSCQMPPMANLLYKISSMMLSSANNWINVFSKVELYHLSNLTLLCLIWFLYYV